MDTPEGTHASNKGFTPSTDVVSTTPVGIGKTSRARVVSGSIFVAAIALIFGRDIFSLVAHAAANEIHSHIILVPLISLYLLYIQRDRLPRTYVTSWVPGLFGSLGAIAAGVAAHVLRSDATPISHNDYLSLIALAMVLALIAGGFFFLGFPWMRSASFAAFFLIFAIPLPDHAVEMLETGSKLASAEVANALFNLSGTPIVRDGAVFQLPGIVIEVAQECSGIRSSWVLLITSLLAAHMFLQTGWRRAVLVALVIPLGVLRNGFRILVIGLLCVHVGPEMINSIIHRRGGPFFFALSLIPLFLVLWWLRRSENGRPATREGNCRDHLQDASS